MESRTMTQRLISVSQFPIYTRGVKVLIYLKHHVFNGSVNVTRDFL